METVLVTGGAGFIGSHIVEKLLENQYKVIVIDNFSTGHSRNLENLQIDVYPCDITDLEVIRLIVSLKPDYIIHEAAQVSVAASIQDLLYDAKVNVSGSLNVIKAAIDASSVKKVVFASSAAVYGNPIELPIQVYHPTRPESPYGLSKRTVEQYLKMAYKYYHLPFSILRYSNVYGPRQDTNGEGGVVTIFADRLSQNTAPIIYGDGEQTRDFIYVQDVAAANVLALKAKGNLCVNVSSGTSITINHLYETMKEAANSHVNALFGEQRPGDIRDSCLSNEDTKRYLEWEPAVNLIEGLRETIQYANCLKKVFV